MAELAALQAELESLKAQAVAAWRADGRSWASIGDALGITRQGAQQRYGKGTES